MGWCEHYRRFYLSGDNEGIAAFPGLCEQQRMFPE